MGGKAILIITIGLGFILGYISLNISSMATKSVDNMAHYEGSQESHALANCGANVGLAKFYSDTSWFGTIAQSFTGADGPTGHLKGGFTVTNTKLSATTTRLRSISTYPVNSSTTYNDTVEVYFDTKQFNSFSLFAYMTNVEGNIWWITGDSVYGRMHSNDIIQVNGTPVFMDKVTTSKYFNPNPGVGTNKAKYKNGYETGVAKVTLPTDLGPLIAASTSGGKRYTTDVWITLSKKTGANKDGKAYVRTTKTGPIIDSVSLNDPSFNGVILGNSRVNVSGSVDAALTIGSLSDIYIQDDLLYENRNLNTTDDLLGLVANNNVVVANNVANNLNCVIDGSVFCRTGSFGAENYDTRPVSGGLYLKGSLVQATRGAVGTFSGSPPVIQHGFLKRYHYDTRLADPNFRPPFYPGFFVRTYAITNWWESVRIPTVL